MKRAVIYTTDLYHPHNDPDDHWDLACQYALAYNNDTDLRGVVCDAKHSLYYGDPSIDAIAQLNYIIGDGIPCAIGCSDKIATKQDMDRVIANKQPASVRMMLRILQEADAPVDIHICGSSRDVAIAATLRPDLFEKKCGGIYLNAGSYDEQKNLEWNVKLEPYAYSQIFKLPCNIYWLPCFKTAPDFGSDPDLWFSEADRASYFCMPQKEVLPYLSQNVQKYFLYMFDKVMDTTWLDYLQRAVNQSSLEYFSDQSRRMWCSAGFVHSAGKTVTKDGSLVDINDKTRQPVFEFEPVSVTCGEDGKVYAWNRAERSNIYMFKKLDSENYCHAMTGAIRNMLSVLP